MIRLILSNFIRDVDEKAYSLFRENNSLKFNQPMERKQNCWESHSVPRFSISQLFLRLGNNGIHKDMGVSY
jgi:hypothetical protein